MEKRGGVVRGSPMCKGLRKSPLCVGGMGRYIKLCCDSRRLDASLFVCGKGRGRSGALMPVKGEGGNLLSMQLVGLWHGGVRAHGEHLPS